MKNQSICLRITAVVIFIFMVALVRTSFADETTNAGMKSSNTHKYTEVTKGALDGKEFVGEMGEQGKTEGGKEVISFMHGNFHSTACDAHGFTAAPYTATKEGNAIHWSATCMSPTEGKLEWSGTVTGNKLEATAMMEQEGKDPVSMWANCTKAKMEGKSNPGHKMNKTASASKTTGTN
jgi:hypothetical protein